MPNMDIEKATGSNKIDEDYIDDDESTAPLTPPMPQLGRQSLLLSRGGSLLTGDRGVYKRHFSLELLNPTHDSNLRKSTTAVAIFNLVATVCGGGVLSLPLACSVAGLVPTLLLICLSAVITNFSLYILCICARRTGGKSYGDVARHAFGPVAEIATTILLFSLLCMVLIAYMVLAKDIWTSIVVFAIGRVRDGDEETEQAALAKWVLLAILVVDFPLFVKRDLHALRHTCYVGFSSLVVLCLALMWRSWERNRAVANPNLFQKEALIWTRHFSDIVFAFPIIANSFMSSFNVLSVHSALIRPTRRRVKFVLDGTVTTCTFFFCLVGVCGYLCAYSETKDNILLNFDASDRAIFVGRVGYAVTIMFSMPLVLLPCREALLSIPVQWMRWRDEIAQLKSYSMHLSATTGHIVNGVNFDEEWPLLATPKGSPAKSKRPGYTRMASEIVDDLRALKEEREEIADLTGFNEELQAPSLIEYGVHHGSTVVILVFCYITALSVPGVAFVWSLCGSSMSMIIAFIIPTACYIKIRARKGITVRSFWAWLLLIFSSSAAIVCTSAIVVNLR